MDTIRAHRINRLLIILTLVALREYFLDIMLVVAFTFTFSSVIYFHVQLHTITQSVEKISRWIDCHLAKEIYS